jgi:hypothetical protein
MIRNLPEGSRLAAAMSVDQPDDAETAEPDPRREAIADHRVWTMDRRLQATQINALYSQIAVSGHWGKEGPPDFPVIGPASWQTASNKESNEPKDNFDVLKRMGWPGG